MIGTRGAESARPSSPAGRRVFLTGFMGAGKTTVGGRLAALLGWRFVDLDQAIERREGDTVAGIFARHGEAGFRRLESRELRRVAAREEVVVATGGGALIAEENRAVIRASGVSVWVDPGLAVIQRRLAGAPGGERPLWGEPGRLEQLYRQRRAGYRTADLRIRVGAEESAGAVAERIRRQLGEVRCAI